MSAERAWEMVPFKAEPGRTWQRIEPSLEDVFIHLMQDDSAPASSAKATPR